MTLFAIPSSWEWTTLGEIADVVGGVTKDSRKQGDPAFPLVPYLRVANVQRGYLDLTNVAQIRVPEATLRKLRLEPGDVLLNEGGDRDKLGRGWVWQGQIPNCIHQNHVFRARIVSGVLHPKLLALFTNECGRDWLERHGTQSVNLASISLTKIKQLPVPIPPRMEQDRLLSALEDHLSRHEVAVTLMKAAELRADGLLARYVDHCISGLAVPTTNLGAVLREPLINGRSVPTEPGGFPVLRLTALASGRLNIMERKAGRWTREEAKRYLVQRGDFFISRGSGSLDLVGRGALAEDVPDEVAFPDTMIRARVDEQTLRPTFLRVVWNSRIVRRQIEDIARTTAGIYKINQRLLEAVSVPLPTIAAQEELVASVERLSSTLSPNRKDVTAILVRSQALRRSLLYAAFGGVLVRQDADDEPASELLERIRRERVAQPKIPLSRHSATAPQEALL